MTIPTIQSASAALLLFLGNVSEQRQIFSTMDGVKFRIEVVLDNLEIPWSIVFDTNGNMYFTERPGRFQVLRKGQAKPVLIAVLKDVAPRGEGGLMGLALHPKFPSNKFLYVSYTTYVKGDLANKVVRFTLDNNKLSDGVDIVPQLPGSSVHNGCRLRFGPDGKLYVTAGDAADREIAQDRQSLGGKILRLNDDGSIPSDNPDPKSAIYAVGVRNPQGIDFHPQTGLLFETEHGPSSFDGPGGGDEVNIVEPGKNYGWPEIHHKVKRAGMESPLLEYTPAVAPASGMFYRGSVFPQFNSNFFFGCLRGQKLIRVILDEKDPRKVVREEHLLEAEFKRIREVAEGPDGYLYFSTSNRDGRARPNEGDDRILRLVPAH